MFGSLFPFVRAYLHHTHDGLVGASLYFLFYITYLLLLFISISFIDAHTPLSARILSPVYIFGVIFVVSVAYPSSNSNKPALGAGGFLAFAVVLICVNAARSVPAAIYRHYNGDDGYTSRAWMSSKTIAYIDALPESATIYSNGADVIGLLTRKHALQIPFKVFPGTLLRNDSFGREINAIRNELIQDEALIVYFDSITWRWYFPTKKELEDMYDIPVLVHLQDGTVYGIKK